MLRAATRLAKRDRKAARQRRRRYNDSAAQGDPTPPAASPQDVKPLQRGEELLGGLVSDHAKRALIACLVEENDSWRHVSPTQDGEAYYERCVRLLADLEETETAFAASSARPKGRLRVDLQGTLAKHFVLPVVHEFFERYPDIELEIGMGDRLVDLVREGVDCVLRAGELSDSAMVARRVAALQQVTCASREYLEHHGVPKTIGDLRGHRAEMGRAS